MKTTKGYDVFQNDKFIGFVAGQNKQNRVKTARQLVRSTHMGQWVKTQYGHEYTTTIGVYIRFEKCKRLTEVLGNYLLKD